MSIEIQFVPIIDKSLFENDKAFIVENENDCKVIKFKGEEILWSHDDDLDKPCVCKEAKEELIYEFLAYIFDKYSSFSGFDGALDDAGYNYFYHLPSSDKIGDTPEDEKKYFENLNIVITELFGSEMLKYNYKLSDKTRQKLQTIYDDNHEKYISYRKEYNIQT